MIYCRVWSQFVCFYFISGFHYPAKGKSSNVPFESVPEREMAYQVPDIPTRTGWRELAKVVLRELPTRQLFYLSTAVLGYRMCIEFDPVYISVWANFFLSIRTISICWYRYRYAEAFFRYYICVKTRGHQGGGDQNALDAIYRNFDHSDMPKLSIRYPITLRNIHTQNKIM